MKISMFTNTYRPHVGGVARSVATFAEDLRQLGHQVQVIAPTFSEQDDAETEPGVVRVPAIQNFNGSDFSVRLPLAGTISEAISGFSPDLIHSHHPFLLGDSALRMARSRQVPLVFTHHTLYEQYTHYVPLDSPAMKRFVSELATHYANLCSLVIAPSTSVRELQLQRGVTVPIEVLPTGIDLDYFARGDGLRFRRELGLTENERIIGHVGRLAREKNLPFLAEAVADAVGKLADTSFLVAGSGDAEAEIREIFSRRQLQDHLVMVGKLTGTRLADCYAAMDLFAFASHSETQGLVIAEAMAAGAPVLALSASGVNDVLADGRNGLLLEAGASTQDFSKALVSSLDDPDKLDSWRRQALKTAGHFSRQNSARQLETLYLRLQETDNRPSPDETAALDTLIAAVRAEWELLQEKTAAALSSIAE